MSRDWGNGFEQWGGYMEAKTSKLRQQYNDVKNIYAENNLFAGISIYVNGHTNPSAEELKRLIMINGGIYHHYESSDTTYIIASNLPDVKVRKTNVDRIISASWVVDCIKENRILDRSRYLLYTNQKPSQPKLTWIQKNVTNAPQITNAVQQRVANQTATATAPKKEQETACGRISEESSIDVEEENRLRETLSVLHTKIKETEKENTFHTSIKTNRDDTKRLKLKESAATTTPEALFLTEYQNNSRLHQISNLATRLKQYVSNLRAERFGKTFPAVQELLEKIKNCSSSQPEEYVPVDYSKPHIMHIDIDCFFVSVGLRSNPSVRHQPVVVTHRTVVGPSSEMSMAEVACASYEARDFGIRNGMLLGEAWSLCPSLKVIPYDFEGYVQVAFALYNTIAEYTLNIEAVSCDEMYVDISDILKATNIKPMEFVRVVRKEVMDKTNCNCSAGVGANKLQARLATKRAKPNGQFHLHGDVINFLTPLLVKDLPGVGSVTSSVLKNSGIKSCGDLLKWTENDLQQLVGPSVGKMLYNYCRGIDNRELEYERAPNSVSVEMNYGIRYERQEQVENALRTLCDKVLEKLTNIKRKAKCVTLKIMTRAKDAPLEAAKYMGHGICDVKQKSTTLPQFTDDLERINNCVKILMRNLHIAPNELRGLGVQLSKFDYPSEKIQSNTINSMFQKQKQRGETVNPSTTITCETNRPSTIDGLCQKQLVKQSVKEMATIAKESKESKCPKETVRTAFPGFQGAIEKTLNHTYQPSTSKAATKQPSIKQWNYIRNNNDCVQVNKDFLKALPADLREEVQQQLKPKTIFDPIYDNCIENCIPNDVENVFLKSNCLQLLLNWLQQCEQPNDYDVCLLCQMAKDLVRNHDLDHLYEAVTYLVRLLNSSLRVETNCSWHLMLKRLVHTIDTEMTHIYNGRTLHMTEKLKCDKCTTITQQLNEV